MLVLPENLCGREKTDHMLGKYLTLGKEEPQFAVRTAGEEV